MILVALFAALIAVGAFIRIPVPLVPFTLQTFFVSLAGMMLARSSAPRARWSTSSWA
jgi:biotin transport system substrate-specific component